VRSRVQILTKTQFFCYFLELMGERDQLNGPARHDHQAAVPCLGRGTRAGRDQLNGSARHDHQTAVPGPRLRTS
jgi:hypothetical protein